VLSTGLAAQAVLTMEGAVGGFAARPLAATAAFAIQDDGSYLSSEVHAHLFEDWHPQLQGAVLNTAKTFVLDADCREGVAHITCKPPHGAVVQPNKQRRRRCVNDIKQLNAAGEAALRREKRGARRGELSKGCVVWRIVRGCKGTPLCDAGRGYGSRGVARGCGCAVVVEYSATIEDVHHHRVRIKVTGVQAVDAASLHSVSHRWDPAQLQAQFAAQFPSRCERVRHGSPHGQILVALGTA